MTHWSADTESFFQRPFKLLSNRVWRTYRGGALIDQWQGKPGAKDNSYPEEWIASVTEARNPRDVHKEGAGLSSAAAATNETVRLLDLIAAHPREMLGGSHAQRFGSDTAVLVKVLDAAERLTIQVHPDRPTAEKLFASSYGKTEAWYILGGRVINGEPPSVYLGFKPHMTRSRWQQLFQAQDSAGMLASLHRFEVEPGQVFFIAGGVPHAIGAGCFLLELQEPTDYTMRPEQTTPSGYRIPDDACHQGLGFAAMFDCFHYQGYSRDETFQRWRVEPTMQTATEETTAVTLIGPEITDCFGLTSIETSGSASIPRDDRFLILVVIENDGRLLWSSPATATGEIAVRQGDQVFVPAGVEKLALQTIATEPVKVVCCYPPPSTQQKSR